MLPLSPQKGGQKRKMTDSRIKIDFFQRKSVTKFLCVKTVSGKVIRHSLACLTVHKWLVGDVTLNANFVHEMNHPAAPKLTHPAAQFLCDSSASCICLGFFWVFSYLLRLCGEGNTHCVCCVVVANSLRQYGTTSAILTDPSRLSHEAIQAATQHLSSRR